MPEIYVACLASYNDGVHHGEWIDAAQDPEDLEREIFTRILKTSPRPNIHVEHKTYECRDCFHEFEVPVGTFFPTCRKCDSILTHLIELPYVASEEWAIHDYEGFGSYKIGEHEDLNFICALAQLAEELGDDEGEALMAFAGNLGWSKASEVDESEFRDKYNGTWASELEYAENYADEFMEIPEQMQFYFDYEAFARDIFINDLYSIDVSGGNVAVFYH